MEQTPAHCGQTALEMVLRSTGADSTALHQADQVYDAVLRGSLFTDLDAVASAPSPTPPLPQARGAA